MRPERASSRLDPPLYHLGSVWPWAGCLNSLGLSFPMCGPGMGLREECPCHWVVRRLKQRTRGKPWSALALVGPTAAPSVNPGTGSHSEVTGGVHLWLFSELPVFWGPLLGGGRDQCVRGRTPPPMHDRSPSQGPPHTACVSPGATVTAWPGGGGLEPGGGQGQEGQGPTSAHCGPHGCPGLFLASANTSQTKSLFLPVLNPRPLPSPSSAKIKTRRWKARYWSGCRGGPASKGNKTSRFVQGTNQAEAKVRQASGSPRKCCLPLGPCNRR